MSNVNTMAVSDTHAPGGCGCGGQEKSEGDCGCGGGEKSNGRCGCDGSVESQPSAFDFGQRFSLDASLNESTATEPFPLGGASAVEVCVTIIRQDAAGSIDFVLHGCILDNYAPLWTETITGGVGFYSFSVSGLVWRELKIGAMAYAGSSPILFSIYAYTSCGA